MSTVQTLRAGERDYELEQLERKRESYSKKDAAAWKEERKRELRKEIAAMEKRSKANNVKSRELDSKFWEKRGVSVVNRMGRNAG